MQQDEIDAKNAEFWNELCGSTLAQALGITDLSAASLHKFDEAYLGIYPYLLPIVQPERFKGKEVLEIGLGFGTLSQQIAEAGAHYNGLDLAPNAAAMVNHRLTLLGLKRTARVGSALEMPFADESFEFVVSIGCFHHTGNIARCLDEAFRILRPGGTAIVMVYNKFSFRQWTRWPWRTLRQGWREWRGSDETLALSVAQRHSYDHNVHGVAAPETQLLSIGQLRQMLARFENVRFQKQNADPISVRGFVFLDRLRLLNSLGRLLGLDIYLEAQKPLILAEMNNQAASKAA